MSSMAIPNELFIQRLGPVSLNDKILKYSASCPIFLKYPKRLFLQCPFFAERSSAARHAVSCGASKADVQYSDHWTVMIDPAGHPFCFVI